MKTLMIFVLALCTFAYAQEQVPPHIDSATVTWDQDAITGHTATLRWSEGLPEPNGVKVNRYVIYRALTQDGVFKRKAGTSQGVTTYTDKTVVSGQTYWFYVKALSTDLVLSGPSSTVAVTIP
jgi:hypothetical protein